MSWRDRANCRGTDTEAFFPEKGGSSAWALRVCGRCEVRVECLEWAIEAREVHGVWGGTSGKTRLRMLHGTRRVRDICDRGHDLTIPANVRVSADGGRRCIPCDKAGRRAA